MTGRGEGYCALRLPDEPDRPADGYAGLQGMPVGPGTTSAPSAYRGPFYRRWPRFAVRPGVAPVRGRGRGARRGRRFAGR
jgi:hypothetical protein